MTRCGHAEKKDLDAARYEERFSVSENPPLDTGRKHKKKPQLGIQTPINQTLAPFPREIKQGNSDHSHMWTSKRNYLKKKQPLSYNWKRPANTLDDLLRSAATLCLWDTLDLATVSGLDVTEGFGAALRDIEIGGEGGEGGGLFLPATFCENKTLDKIAALRAALWVSGWCTTQKRDTV